MVTLLFTSSTQAIPGPAPVSTMLADYDLSTGEIGISYNGVNNWFIESASLGLIGDPPVFPETSLSLKTDNYFRIGEAGLATDIVSSHSLGKVAVPGLPFGDLVLHYNAGLGVPPVSIDVSVVDGGGVIDPIEPTGVNIGNWSGSEGTWNNAVDYSSIAAAMARAGHSIEADGPITAADLSNDNLFIIGVPLTTPTAGELSDLADWVNGGGSLLVFTGQDFRGGADANNILAGIGSSMSFTSARSRATGPFQGGNFATTGPPFNIVGQDTTQVAVQANRLSGGTVLYGNAGPEQAGIRVEQIGAGFVYAFGGQYATNYSAPSEVTSNGQFFLNIAHHYVVPEPTTFALVAFGFLSALQSWRTRM